MASAVGSAFVVIAAEALLELAVVVLDAPAELGEVHECRDWRVAGGLESQYLTGSFLPSGQSANNHGSGSAP